MARKPASRDSPTTVPSIVERDYSLARMATVRTGGEAEWFARAGSKAQLRELLAWARAANVPVAVVGSGSNLLIADEGVRGLVVKLDRKLALIQREGPLRIVCGGGARLPAVATRAAQAGLSGIEFGVNIPGTVGGAVRMNANAYGGELARTLEWVEIVTAEGSERRVSEQLGFAYRRSNLTDGEIVARASFLLAESDAATVKATLSEMRARRHEAQPQGIKTFGSTFVNPRGAGPHAEGPHRRTAAVRGGLQRLDGRWRPPRAQARQLRREHRRRHDRRRARGDGRGPRPRAGALRRGARARGADTGGRAVSVGPRPGVLSAE